MANVSLAFSFDAKTLVPPPESCAGSAIDAAETIRFVDLAVTVAALEVGGIVVDDESGAAGDAVIGAVIEAKGYRGFTLG